ncbi:MAG: OmpA family protein [Acidobacteria bacterium]|nr:OmpA family protein [Acidobacteriota bacterium]
MSLRRAVPLIAVLSGLILLSSCATKKYVRQEIATTQADLSKRIDDEASRRAELANQVGELSALNKKNASRIEEVQGNLNNAVKTLDPKIEDAKRTGIEAGDTARRALDASKQNAALFENRNNLQVISSHDILFKFGSAALDDQAKTQLADVGRLVAGNKNLLVELQGFTDSVGDVSYNIQLSNRRVENALRYLVSEAKVDLHRISSLGLGEANPVDDNKTSAGRAKNRRVTVTILGLK